MIESRWVTIEYKDTSGAKRASRATPIVSSILRTYSAEVLLRANSDFGCTSA
jgi:hypothetical protein